KQGGHKQPVHRDADETCGRGLACCQDRSYGADGARGVEDRLRGHHPELEQRPLRRVHLVIHRIGGLLDSPSPLLQHLGDPVGECRLPHTGQPDELYDGRSAFGIHIFRQTHRLIRRTTCSNGSSASMSTVSVTSGNRRPRMASARFSSSCSCMSGFRRCATSGRTWSLRTRSGTTCSAQRYGVPSHSATARSSRHGWSRHLPSIGPSLKSWNWFCG